ncbi:hypothetical protein OH77DRAFT_1419602 [Trametes cingulata]|nr:hypothetical protein OH77DRAFT_1419602 [Trametes cingulata]
MGMPILFSSMYSASGLPTSLGKRRLAVVCRCAEQRYILPSPRPILATCLPSELEPSRLLPQATHVSRLILRGYAQHGFITKV